MQQFDTKSSDDLITVLGLPWDGGSTFLRGPAHSPGRIRESLLSPGANLSAETGLDLSVDRRWRLAEDLSLAGSREAVRRDIEGAAAEVLATGSRLLSLGGDHSVTHPLLRAHRQVWPELLKMVQYIESKAAQPSKTKQRPCRGRRALLSRVPRL